LADRLYIPLRKAQDSSQPFGGVKVLLVGDFFQLPPVIPNHEKAVLGQLGYAGPFAYHANVLENYTPIHFELSKVYRQRDSRFVEILSDLRVARNVDEAVGKLNDICVKPHRAGHTPVLLTSTNAIAERYNRQGLHDLTTEPVQYECKTEGRFNANRAPAPMQISLKKGSRVMAVKNDPMKRWVNGSLGTIVELNSKEVYVKFDKEQKMEEEATATFSQMPLILAWAVTIHKAQGLTLDDVRIDLGRGAFAPLSLTAPLRVNDIQTH